MMNSALDWDEFRLVKAIADARSLVGAAEALGLNHSTVFRRLARDRNRDRRAAVRAFARRLPADAGGRGNDRAGDRDGRFDHRVRTPRRRPRREADRRIARHHGRCDRRSRCCRRSSAHFRAVNPGVQLELIVGRAEAQSVAPRRRRRDPRHQRAAGGAGRPAHLRGALGGLLPAALAARVRRARRRGGALDRLRRNLRAAARQALDRGRTSARAARSVASTRVLCMAEAAAPASAPRCCRASSATPSRAAARRRSAASSTSTCGSSTHADLRHSARVRAFMEFAGAELAKVRKVIEGAGGESD